MTNRYWAVFPACLILGTAVAAHGWRTDRWGVATDLRAAAERLDALPLQVGDWEGEGVEMTPSQAGHGIVGLAARRYTHRYTRATVSVLVLCGRPGHVSVHTPDVCYGNAGYEMGPAQSEAFTPGHSAWVADFVKPGGQSETLRIRWAWSDGGSWVAAPNPRTTFLRSPLLYKIYLVRSLSGKAESDAGAPEIDLMKDLLPSLRTSLSLR